MFCIQGLTSRGLTRKEDRGRLLPFEQSCRPGVKTQPESHSEHAGSCQLQDEKHVYCLWRRFNVLSVRLYSNTSVILHICPHLQINHRETHVKQKDTELATEPRKGLKSERNWASTLLSNRKGRPLVGIKNPNAAVKAVWRRLHFSYKQKLCPCLWSEPAEMLLKQALQHVWPCSWCLEEHCAHNKVS